MIMIKASELVFNSLRLWVILGSCTLSRLLLTNAYHPGKDQFNFYVQFPCLNLVEISIFSLQFKCCFFFSGRMMNVKDNLNVNAASKVIFSHSGKI